MALRCRATRRGRRCQASWRCTRPGSPRGSGRRCRLTRELRERGYEGGVTILREHLARLRPAAVPEPVVRSETAIGHQMQRPVCVGKADRRAAGAFCTIRRRAIVPSTRGRIESDRTASRRALRRMGLLSRLGPLDVRL